MRIDRVYTPGLAQVAYLVADEAARQAAVIDPRRDIDDYLAWAARHGVQIVAILETHVHADFVSGARELAAATGAPVYAGARADLAFPHVGLRDGDEVAVGRLRLRAVWTPGHTPEHVAYLLVDPERGEEPLALFSGDSLFVGEIGRPDLLGDEQTADLARQLYDTVGRRLIALPDDLVVYPGHTAGSPCGKQIGDAPQTTIGQEKRFNYAFQPAALASEAAFGARVMAGMPKPPAYYPAMKRVNKAGPALIATLPAGEPLAPPAVEARQRDGALVLDARPPAAFAAGHIPGAIFDQLGPSFAIWAGWLTPFDRDVILVLDRPEQFNDARTELRRIGVDRVAGWLDGGMAAWIAGGRPVATTAMTDAPALASDLARPDADLVVLDVRDPSEWAGERVPGAINVFAGDLAQGAPVDLPPAGQIAVICGSGHRSLVATSLLRARGAANLVNVAGGMSAWNAADLPIERGASTAV